MFNNIVEHAYAGTTDGSIDVTVERQSPGMHFTFWDNGVPMPTGRLPGGNLPDPELAGHEQAEGGYGLRLIRQLARKLRYERVGNKNRLSFRIPLDFA